jgi:hypothetical protein
MSFSDLPANSITTNTPLASQLDAAEYSRRTPANKRYAPPSVMQAVLLTPVSRLTGTSQAKVILVDDEEDTSRLPVYNSDA